MSSCLIITQGNKMYIGADTACSIITEDGYRRFSDDMPKLFSLGNSVFFCSGRKIDAEKCVNWIYDNFKTEIDIKELEHYFKDVSTVVNKDNLFNIEFLLCDYNNHKVVQLSQYNDFKPMIYDYSDELRILCGGYKTKDSFLMAKKNLILNKSTREIYKDVFESISDECVGGKVILYNSPTSFEIISLKESDIKYANNDNELFLLTSDFVTSGVVNGSQIIGGDIYSENYSPTTGTHINLNDGSFNFGHKIIYDAPTDKMTMKGVIIEWDSTNTPEIGITDISGLEDHLNQLDGRIQTYSQDTDPSINWTNEEKQSNVGDLWFDTKNDLTKRWNGTTWEVATDSNLEKLAKSKAQIFTTTPTVPYYVGDLWVQGSSGDIMNCIKSRESGSYTASDWKKSSKYTDDSALETFISGEYIDDLQDIGKQIDGKARSWYQPTDPSLTWDKNENHEGDLWYNTSANSQVTSIYDNGAWKATSVPKELFDTIDGIASIYVTIPDKPQIGDLLIPTSNIGSYKSGKVYKYNGTSWVEISYTDDTKANEAYNLANSAKGIAENAKTIGDNLVNGLGFQETEITGKYVISPVIAGGTLLIGDTNSTYAQITTEGKLICTGAEISGDIVANSLTLGNGVTIPSTSIDGLDSTIKGYGYQTKAEAQKIVEAYGYQTKANVTSLITSYGYKNADEVKDIVEGYGYTTNSAAYQYLIDGDYFLVSGTKISEITGYTEFKNSLVLKSSISSTTSTETITLPSGEKVNRTTYTTTVPNSDGTSKTFKTYDDGAYVFTNIGIGNGSSDPENSTSTDTYVMIDKNGCLTADNAVIRGNIYAINGYFNGTVHATDGEFTGKITASSGSITGNLDLGGSLTNTKGNYTVTLRGVVENNPGAGVFYITDKSSGSNAYPFILNGDGSFTATKATITGKINAQAGGTIGGFTIGSNNIVSGTWGTDNSVMICTGTTTSTTIGGKYTNGWCFTAGSKFGVTKNGDVYASNVDITGKINAISGNMDSVTATNLTVTSGTIKLGDATINENGITIAGNQLGTSTISGWKVFNNRIAKLETSVNKGLPVSVGISCDSGNYAFWAGGADANGNASISGTDMDAGKYTDTFKPAFAVRQNGEIIATKGKIGDMSIHSDGSLGGSGMMIYPNGKKYTSFSNTYYISIIYNGGMIALNQNGTWDTIY